MTTRRRTKGPTPVISAVLARDAPRLRATLQAGANVDERDMDGRSGLHHACIQNEEVLVELLLKFKAQVAPADNDGWTPLHFAARNHQVGIAQKLLQAGAPVDATDAHGNTPLFRAVFESKGRGEMIKFLLEAGADQDRSNNHGTSPAALAATIANYNVRQWLKQ